MIFVFLSDPIWLLRAHVQGPHRVGPHGARRTRRSAFRFLRHRSGIFFIHIEHSPKILS